MIQKQSDSIEALRNNIQDQRMRDENQEFESYFTNITTYRSRLEFSNYLINDSKCLSYLNPHQ
jgi:hypothetical protein